MLYYYYYYYYMTKTIRHVLNLKKCTRTSSLGLKLELMTLQLGNNIQFTHSYLN